MVVASGSESLRWASWRNSPPWSVRKKRPSSLASKEAPALRPGVSPVPAKRVSSLVSRSRRWMRDFTALM